MARGKAGGKKWGMKHHRGAKEAKQAKQAQ
jgi:hypothetical protein